MSHWCILRPPPPIEPGYYAVQFIHPDDPVIKVVHMMLERYGYRSRLLEFCALNDCRILAMDRVKDTVKDLKWTRTE